MKRTLPSGSLKNSRTILVPLQQPSDQPKRLKLVLREVNIVSHLEEIGLSKDASAAHQLLLGVKEYYPLSSEDIDFLFFRLLDNFRQIWFVQPEIAYATLGALLHVIRQPWFAGSFSGIRTVVKMLTEYLQDAQMPGGLQSMLLSILLHIEHCIDPEGKSFGAITEVALKLLKCGDLSEIRSQAVTLLANLAIRIHSDDCEYLSGHVLDPQKRPPGSPRLLLSPRAGSSRKYSSRSVPRSGMGSTRLESVIPEIPIESILTEYSKDLDSRVRAETYNCWQRLHDANWPVSEETYKMSCDALNDNDSNVRLLGVKLVWTFAQKFPEKTVSGQSTGVQLRLVDDAFVRLCNAMHDLCIEVREKAASLLGTMTNVSKQFLEQTLDKKLMSQNQFLRSGAVRGRRPGNRYLHSEWSTGRRFGADIPVEKSDEDSASLIPSGACGAFVIGLEDEYMVVRNASVSAVSSLGEQHPNFASMALDFLADMFNDEIHQVRLNSIVCLRRLCHHFKLKEEQTEIVLNALDDFNWDSREALREFLCSCTLLSRQCLKMAFDALLNNLRRYPGDRLSIWRCVKHLGLNHPEHTLSFTPVLLGKHAFFDTAEPNMEDHTYITTLILIVNAAYKCPSIKSQFVAHTWRHYQFLRESLPDFVPVLVELKDRPLESDCEVERKQCWAIVEKLRLGLERTTSISTGDKIRFLETYARYLTNDVTAVCKQVSNSKAVAVLMFVKAYLQCRISLEKENRQSVLRIPTVKSCYFQRLFKILQMVVLLKWEFATSSSNQLASLTLELKLRALTLLATAFPQDARGLLHSFMTNCEKYPQKFLESPLWTSLSRIFRSDPSLISELHKRSSRERGLLITCLRNTPFLELDYCESNWDEKVSRITAEVTEPEPEQETITKFTSSLLASVRVEANVSNVTNEVLNLLRFKVAYPDKKVQLFKPRESELKKVGEEGFKILSHVLLSHVIWTDPCRVELSIVLLLDDTDLIKTEQETLRFVQMSDPVLFRVLPKLKC